MDLRAALVAAVRGAAGVAVAALLAAPAAASANEHRASPESLPATPTGFAVDARRALEIADRDPQVAAQRAEHGELRAEIKAVPGRRWEVGFRAREERVALAVVDGVSGELAESWTGAQVSWPMARGREGQFGHVLNAPYVWIPLSVLFCVGLLDFRRPARWVHLDLLVLLSFAVSHVFFNRAEIGLSVPLAYPPLAYLLARMLWIGFRGRGLASLGLRPTAPTAVLAVLCVALIGFRVAINVFDSGVIDVGYAGVVGADRITSAQPIYGEGAFPDGIPRGDTYGPANYFAYVPFEAALPWSGSWDALPAAHAAAIAFDLATIVGLFALGAAFAGRRTGVILAFAWAAYPYTAFALQSNANDALIGALLVWSLVLFGSPLARGALLATAAAAKFAPLALVPLYAAGRRRLGTGGRDGSSRSRTDRILPFAAAFAGTAALFLAHPAIDPGLATFWERTIANQASRESPFSIWGQIDLGPLRGLVIAAAAGMALALAFVPRGPRTLPRVAALGAAALIATQLTVEHWFYLYIPWFLPLLLAALALPERTASRIGS